MGARGVAVLSGPDPGESARAEGGKLLVDSLKRICAYSKERKGPPVVLESFDRGIGKNCLIGPSEEAREIAEEVGKEFPESIFLWILRHEGRSGVGGGRPGQRVGNHKPEIPVLGRVQ